jgi:hypothetical protein
MLSELGYELRVCLIEMDANSELLDLIGVLRQQIKRWRTSGRPGYGPADALALPK